MNNTQTIKDTILQGSVILQNNSIENSYNEAIILFSSITKLSKEFIIGNGDFKISEREKIEFFNYIERRIKFEPIAYIIGHKEFWSLDFLVNSAVLIPRPDSEILVHSTLKHSPLDKKLNILELGTGSGCLLLSILSELPEANGIGIDISHEAVLVAKNNAQRLNLDEQAKFKCLDWNSFSDEYFDIIISNPPYIPTQDIAKLAQDLNYEPFKALDGGSDGLECYKQILNLLPNILIDDGIALFEIGYGQKDEISILIENRNFKILEVINDLANIPRVITFTKI